MPLLVEVYQESRGWVHIGTINPGEPAGSISDNHEGQRDVYLFTCLRDDSQSIIYRSKRGLDIESGKVRDIISNEFDIIRRLAKRDSYEMQVKTDASPKPRRIRFTHN